MQIELKTFLQTGELGSLHLGMTQDQVLTAVGSPDFCRGVTVNPRPDLADWWYYGPIGLKFRWDKPEQPIGALELIGVYLNTPATFPKHWSCVGYFPPTNVSVMDLEDYLRKESLRYETVHEKMRSGVLLMRGFVTDGGVRINTYHKERVISIVFEHRDHQERP